MTVYYPEATPVQGNVKVVSTASVADPAAPKLATEINAATSEDVSLTFRDWNPVVNANSGTAPRRLGTKNQMPQEGLAQYQAIEIRYPYAPQEDDTHADNAAKAAHAEGAFRDFVVRKGLDAETDPMVVGDRTETWQVRCGRQTFTRSGDDEFAEFEVVQMVYPVKPEGHGVVVA